MKEIWKDIKEYEGIYQVSNQGRIKSLERIVANNKKGKIYYRRVKLLHNKKISSFIREKYFSITRSMFIFLQYD